VALFAPLAEKRSDLPGVSNRGALAGDESGVHQPTDQQAKCGADEDRGEFQFLHVLGFPYGRGYGQILIPILIAMTISRLGQALRMAQTEDQYNTDQRRGPTL
jgi:hypothetical protein